MSFMINKETENVRSSEDIEMAFRALSKDLRRYVTAEELYAVNFLIYLQLNLFFLELESGTSRVLY